MTTMDIPINFANNATSFMTTRTPTASTTTHPYYPVDAVIAGYMANEWSVAALLGAFFGVCTVLFSGTYYVAKSVQPKLDRTELLTTMWFVLSGSIHIFFEGYYVAHFETLGKDQTVIGQMWKEYAYSDSRYLTQNSMVLCLETITALFWGPGCLLVAALVMLRHPFRYPLQCLVSFGQLYGDTLYYATSFFDHQVMGVSYSRPEAFYFWFYFVGMNAFWIFIPAILIYQGSMKAAHALAMAPHLEASRKGQ